MLRAEIALPGHVDQNPLYVLYPSRQLFTPGLPEDRMNQRRRSKVDDIQCSLRFELQSESLISTDKNIVQALNRCKDSERASLSNLSR